MADPEISQNSEAANSRGSNESFADILSEFQKSHSRKVEGGKQLEAIVISVTPEAVYFDIGLKS